MSPVEFLVDLAHDRVYMPALCLVNVGMESAPMHSPALLSGTKAPNPPPLNPKMPLERWTSRWGRRFLSIGGIYIALLLSLAFSPILLLVLGGLDLRSTPRRFGRLRFLAMLYGYLASESISLLLAFALWLLWPFLGNERFIALNYRLQARWTQTLFNLGKRIYKIQVDAEGLEQVKQGPILVFVRHVSVADTLLPAVLIANRLNIRLRYVLKRELLWDPCLDVVGQRISNAFVARDGAETERQLAMVQRLAEDLGPRDGVLIFPEGTRFSPDRLARIQARDRERGRTRSERFRHVLPPRLGGPLTLLKAAKGSDIVVLAHTGFDSVRRFDDLLGGALYGTVLCVRMTRIPASKIPSDEEELAAFLYKLWWDVDAFVEQHPPRSSFT